MAASQTPRLSDVPASGAMHNVASTQLLLGGAVKAALWLLSAEEEVAVATLKHLLPDEIKRLRVAAETIQKISPEQLALVHSEFARLLEEQPLRLRGSLDYLGRLAVEALGEAKAASLFRVSHDGPPPATVLLEADSDALAATLMEEHPQVVAAVLTTLTPQRAWEVANLFPEQARIDILSRLAQLSQVPQDSLARAQQILSQGLPQVANATYQVDGVRIAATLLNQVDKPEAERLLKLVAEGSEPVSQQVRAAMFTFDDLARLDKRGIQTLLKDVPSDRLLLALKAATDTLKSKIFEGLSKRAGDMMREDLSAMAPQKIKDVEKAQLEVVAVAIKLRDEGKITVSGSGKGDLV